MRSSQVDRGDRRRRSRPFSDEIEEALEARFSARGGAVFNLGIEWWIVFEPDADEEQHAFFELRPFPDDLVDARFDAVEMTAERCRSSALMTASELAAMRVRTASAMTVDSERLCAMASRRHGASQVGIEIGFHRCRAHRSDSRRSRARARLHLDGRRLSNG